MGHRHRLRDQDALRCWGCCSAAPKVDQRKDCSVFVVHCAAGGDTAGMLSRFHAHAERLRGHRRDPAFVDVSLSGTRASAAPFGMRVHVARACCAQRFPPVAICRRSCHRIRLQFHSSRHHFQLLRQDRPCPLRRSAILLRPALLFPRSRPPPSRRHDLTIVCAAAFRARQRHHHRRHAALPLQPSVRWHRVWMRS